LGIESKSGRSIGVTPRGMIYNKLNKNDLIVNSKNKSIHKRNPMNTYQPDNDDFVVLDLQQRRFVDQLLKSPPKHKGVKSLTNVPGFITTLKSKSKRKQHPWRIFHGSN
jgi:hypothetical protein